MPRQPLGPNNKGARKEGDIKEEGDTVGALISPGDL